MKILTLNKEKITDFSFERNKLMQSVSNSNDWILFLDRDEKLFKTLSNLSDKYDCYKLLRRNYFLGKYVGCDIIIRVIKKGSGKWSRSVHETFVPSNDKKIGFIKDNFIIHNTADNLSGYLKKINFYSTLHAKENKKEAKKSTLFKIIFFPIGKFIVTLVKSKNIVFSIMQSLHSYLSWTKMYFRTEQN